MLGSAPHSDTQNTFPIDYRYIAEAIAGRLTLVFLEDFDHPLSREWLPNILGAYSMGKDDLLSFMRPDFLQIYSKMAGEIEAEFPLLFKTDDSAIPREWLQQRRRWLAHKLAVYEELFKVASINRLQLNANSILTEINDTLKVLISTKPTLFIDCESLDQYGEKAVLALLSDKSKQIVLLSNAANVDLAYHVFLQNQQCRAVLIEREIPLLCLANVFSAVEAADLLAVQSNMTAPFAVLSNNPYDATVAKKHHVTCSYDFMDDFDDLQQLLDQALTIKVADRAGFDFDFFETVNTHKDIIKQEKAAEMQWLSARVNLMLQCSSILSNPSEALACFDADQGGLHGRYQDYFGYRQKNLGCEGEMSDTVCSQAVEFYQAKAHLQEAMLSQLSLGDESADAPPLSSYSANAQIKQAADNIAQRIKDQGITNPRILFIDFDDTLMQNNVLHGGNIENITRWLQSLIDDGVVPVLCTSRARASGELDRIREVCEQLKPGVVAEIFLGHVHPKAIAMQGVQGALTREHDIYLASDQFCVIDDQPKEYNFARHLGYRSVAVETFCQNELSYGAFLDLPFVQQTNEQVNVSLSVKMHHSVAKVSSAASTIWADPSKALGDAADVVLDKASMAAQEVETVATDAAASIRSAVEEMAGCVSDSSTNGPK